MMKSVKRHIPASKRRQALIGWRARSWTAGLGLVLLHWAACASVATAAAVGASTPNQMPSRVEIAIGDSVNITCSAADSSAIWFYEEKTQRSIDVNSDLVAVLDPRTAVLMIRNAPEQQSVYRCMSGGYAIGETMVHVGTPPLDVDDFQCRGYDYVNMTCTFTRPRNSIYTYYKVKYGTDTAIPEYEYNCTVQENDSYMFFSITSQGGGCKYLPLRDNYNFHITGVNALGTNTQVFTVDNRESVIPAKLNINIHHHTTDSVTLKWKNGQFAYYNDQGLVYDIEVKPKGFAWYTVPPADYEHCIRNNCSLTIRKLKYPHWAYDVQVRVRVNSTRIDENMWSEPYIGEFETKSRRPDFPPKTAIGSFYIDPAESELRLYWEALMPYEQNGPGFFYVVNETDASGNVLTTMPTNETSIVFPWRRVPLIYNIKAVNELGDSIDASEIRVYPIIRDAVAYTPENIARLYHNRAYTLTWKAPKRRLQLSNYTVFWCLARIESTTQCRGTIYSEYIDVAQENYTTEPQNHTLILAVSANYPNYSTGMRWAICSADVTTDLMKMEPQANATSATEIRIHWNLENICTSVLKGYNITYCQVSETVPSGEEFKCISAPRTFSLLRSDKEYKDYTITGLKPYSMYRIGVLMYSQSKVGPMSDPLFIRTNETAPTPPQALSVNLATVTSNSAQISWYAPEIINGHLQRYTVWWRANNNTESKSLELKDLNITDNANEPITYKLQSLSSYSVYAVYVTAHTVESSMPSRPVQFRTLIGRPSTPPNVNIIAEGDSRILEWASPEVPSGRVEIYEISMVTKFKNNNSEEQKTYIVGGLSRTTHRCRFRPPECTAATELFFMRVRAVNLVDKQDIDNSTFLVASASKRRRHTSPAISTSTVHRQTYDEGPQKMASNIVAPGADVGGNYVEVYHAPQSDFQCTPINENGEASALLLILNNNSAPEKYRLESDWKNSQESYLCTAFSWDSALGLAIMVLFGMAFTGLVTYMGHKKYSKMKNIEAILPEGLVDHMAVSTKFANGIVGNGYDNNLEKELSEISNSFDFLNLHPKEDCHLLNSTNALNSLTPSSADSNSSTSSGCGSASDNNGRSGNKELLEPCQNEERSSQSTDTLEIRDGSTSSCNDSPLRHERVAAEGAAPVPSPNVADSSLYEESPYLRLGAAPTNTSPVGESSDKGSGAAIGCGVVGGYVTPSTLLFARNAALDSTPKTFPTASSGYVQPNAVMMLASPTSATPLQPQQIASSDGYITADAIGKATIAAPATTPPTALDVALQSHAVQHKLQNALNVDDSLAATLSNTHPSQSSHNNNNNSICGYVTQRQLAEFGQLIH